jgi:hypothetical protein
MEENDMEYGRIIKRAVEITWRHKVLWVFGIVAALFGAGYKGSNGGSNAGSGLQYTFSGSDLARLGRAPWPQEMPFSPNLSGNWAAILPVVLGILAILVIVGLVLWIVGILVRYTSLGALVSMVDEVEQTERTSFKSGLQHGWKRFLRLFAIDLLIAIAMFFVALLFLVVGVFVAALVIGPTVLLIQAGKALIVLGIIWAVGLGLIALLALIVAIFALSALVTLIREFAFRACVLDQKGVFNSLGAAITLTRSRFAQAGMMWLLLLGIRIVLGFITIPLVLIGLGIVAGPAIATWAATQSMLAAAIVAIPFVLVLIAVSALISGILVTFESALWTLTYRELRGKEVLAGAA